MRLLLMAVGIVIALAGIVSYGIAFLAMCQSTVQTQSSIEMVARILFSLIGIGYGAHLTDTARTIGKPPPLPPQ
jgi:hypothetical protein